MAKGKVYFIRLGALMIVNHDNRENTTHVEVENRDWCADTSPTMLVDSENEDSEGVDLDSDFYLGAYDLGHMVTSAFKKHDIKPDKTYKIRMYDDSFSTEIVCNETGFVVKSQLGSFTKEDESVANDLLQKMIAALRKCYPV